MRRVPIIAAACAVLMFSGCAGKAARSEILLPGLRQEWPPIAADVEAYLGTSPEDGAPVRAARDGFAAALEVDDRPTMATTWPVVKPAAMAGVGVRHGAGLIGPVGAEIARDHIAEYGARVRQLTQGTR